MDIPFRLRIDATAVETGSPGSDPMQEAVEALTGATSLEDKEVLAAFRKAVNREPTDPDYHYILGEALVRMGREAEALPALRDAIGLSPNDPAYCYAHGEALWELGRFEEAVADFREASRLHPADARTLNALGAALTQSGGEREAIGVFQSAIRIDGARSAVHANLGVALWKTGQAAAALRVFRTAVRLEPSSPDALRNLALALGSSAEREESLKYLGQLARLHPSDPQAHLDLGDALYAAGRPAEAAKAYDEAARLDPASFRSRPASREARDAIAISRVQEEVKAEAATGPRFRAALLGGLFAAVRALVRVPRGFVLVVWLGVLAAVAYAAWQIIPPYLTYHLLRDKVVEIARAPVTDDADVRDRLMHAVRDYGLAAQLQETAFEISSATRWRTIRCEYDVAVQILPGVTHKLRFRIRVEEPYLPAKDPQVY